MGVREDDRGTVLQLADQEAGRRELASMVVQAADLATFEQQAIKNSLIPSPKTRSFSILYNCQTKDALTSREHSDWSLTVLLLD